MTIGAMSHALLGIQQNQRRFERAADDVRRATTVDQEAVSGSELQPDLTDAALCLLTARRGMEASLAVARSADEMLGTLIDVLA